MKCLCCRNREISDNKMMCAECVAKGAWKGVPRFDKTFSPLKIAFYAGDAAAPLEMQAADERPDADLTGNETCLLTDWEEAFAVLKRTQQEWFAFHSNDHDWQVNGWLMEKAGLLPLTPLTPEELKEGEYWPHLPLNPTTADYAAEVLIQYYGDINLMSHDNIVKRMRHAGYANIEAAARKMHQSLYLPLMAGLDSWTDAAMEQMSLPQGKTYRIDQRLLYKAAYEVHFLGGTKINPLQEEVDMGANQTLLDFALTHDLVPGARKIVPKNWGGGQRE